VSTVLLAASGSAMAFTGAADYQVVFGGATASTNSVRNLIIDEVCDSTAAIDVFRRGPSPASFSNDWAVACEVAFADLDGNGSNDLDIVGQKVLFTKRDAGGSGTGVGPVEAADPFLVLSNTTGSGGNCSGAHAATTGTGIDTAFTEWNCGATNVSKTPDAGFSDIEPDKFIGINTPVVDGTPLPFNGLGNLTVKPLGGLTFNTPVSLNLRNALQAAQGLVEGSDTPANQPSLPSGLIRALFTGDIKTWDEVKVTDGGSVVALRNHSAVNAADKPATPLVHVCRRVNGSGTQAQFNAIFTNWPCDTTVKTVLSEPGNPLVGPVIRENSGSSDVSRCLDDFSDGTNTSGENLASGPLPANRKAWAIGPQSTENNTDDSFSYRFIKVDGFAPTLVNVHNGNYFDFAEQSMQWRSDTSTFNAADSGDDDDALAILNHIAREGASPEALASLNEKSVYDWGQAGWLAVPGDFASEAELDIDTPVNAVTRSPGGNSPNTCQLPTAVDELLIN
jgi:hypothetical protein